MRHLTTLTVLAASAALAAPSAHAKPGHELLVQSIDVAAPTGALVAGEPWMATVTITSARPGVAAAELRRGGDVLVTIVEADAGISRIVTADPTDDPLVWRARVEFPGAGVWAIGAHALMVDAAPMTVWVAPAPGGDDGAAAAGAPGGGSTPWAAVVAACVTASVIVCALVLARRGRPQPA